MFGRGAAADTAAVVLDPQTRYGAGAALRGELVTPWADAPQNLIPAPKSVGNTQNMPRFLPVTVLPPTRQQPQMKRLISSYTFLPVGGRFQAPRGAQ